MKKFMRSELIPNGEFVTIDGHRMHIFRTGNVNRPKLVFMSGSGTGAPVYDFKVLYEKLSSDFRIIVIEKFGYGYSDLYDGPQDIDTLVEQQRTALQELGEAGPFILLPHSYSGLEAIRWRQKYPEDIKAIAGLDMATPVTYIEWGEEELAKRARQMQKLQVLARKGLLFWYPLNKRCLTKDEIIQQKLLWKRNAMNDCVITGSKVVVSNAKLIAEGGAIDCPVILFVSNGKQVTKNWIEHEREFAKRTNAEYVQLNCGHYIFYYEPERITEEIKAFLHDLDH